MEEYYCMECNEVCSVTEVDEGIGVYEYWGSREIDIKIVKRSGCCDAKVTEQQETV